MSLQLSFRLKADSGSEMIKKKKQKMGWCFSWEAFSSVQQWLTCVSFCFQLSLYRSVCEVCDAALTAFPLKAAAVRTVHPPNRPDSSCVSVRLQLLGVNLLHEPVTSVKNHKPLYCCETQIKKKSCSLTFERISGQLQQIPSPSTVLLHLITVTNSMKCIHLPTETANV